MSKIIKIVALEDVDINKVVNFYEEHGNYSASSISEKLMNSNGHYKCHGVVALLSDGEIAGAYLGLPQIMLTNPHLKASQSMDTLIATKYRGTGLLLELATCHYSKLETAGFECVFGIPNKLIEKVRYMRLGWNMSRQIYRYIVYWPTPFLWIFDKIFQIGVKLNILSSLEESLDKSPRLTNAEKHLIGIKIGFEVIIGYGCLAIIKAGNFKTKIGIIRSKRKTSIFDRLRFLTLLVKNRPCSILISYATKGSETAQFLSQFSINQESLHFSGRLLGARRGASFGEQHFEFLEYDTF